MRSCFACSMPLPELSIGTAYCPTCHVPLAPYSLPESVLDTAARMILDGRPVRDILEELSEQPMGKKSGPEEVTFARLMRQVSTEKMLDYLLDAVIREGVMRLTFDGETPDDKLKPFVELLQKTWGVVSQQKTNEDLDDMPVWEVTVTPRTDGVTQDGAAGEGLPVELSGSIDVQKSGGENSAGETPSVPEKL